MSNLIIQDKFQSLVYWKGGDKFYPWLALLSVQGKFQSLVYWKGGDKFDPWDLDGKVVAWFQSLVYWKGGDKFFLSFILVMFATRFNPWFIGRVGINILLR